MFLSAPFLALLFHRGFYLFNEIFPDVEFYFGKKKKVLDIDRFFGSKLLLINGDSAAVLPGSEDQNNLLSKYAKVILNSRIRPEVNVRKIKDVIAIRREVYELMAGYFL